MPIRPDSIDPITYKFYSVQSDVKTAFRTGEQVWDGTSAPGYFSEGGGLDPEINVIDRYRVVEWAGETRGQCGSSGIWDGNEVEIEFNNVEFARFTTYQKKIIAMHEIGHAYGLYHVYSGCHLMKQGADKFTCGTMPSTDDVNGVTAIY